MACGVHSPQLPDECFTCKMDYMRSNPGLIAVFPKHWSTQGLTDREKRRQLYSETRSKGADLEKA